MSYAFHKGGMMGQDANPEACFVLPAVTHRDIVTSFLPHWKGTRAYILARQLSGFAETFSQYAIEIWPNGNSMLPEVDMRAEAVLFVTHETPTLTFGRDTKRCARAALYLFRPVRSGPCGAARICHAAFKAFIAHDR